jgi:hypothetical protein
VTPLQQVTSALEAHGSRRVARDWQCPAHQDQRASLSVNEGRDGRVVLHCHAGCDTTQVLDALGLRLADLFPRDDQADDDTWTPRGPAIATYRYVDEDGRLLFAVARTADKQFPQWRPDPTKAKGRSWKLDDTRRVLYRLPRVIAAAAAGEPIYIAEGEKDVHAIEAAGAVATCNPGGAGKWRAEYAQPLHSAHVIVIADRDPPGIEHARRVAATLTGTAASVRVVQAAAGKDAADHLAGGHPLTDLQPLDLETDATTHPPPSPPPPAGVPDLIEILASYQDLDDTGHVWFALAVAVSGLAFDDDPLWGMLVGPPSSGKTETVRALGSVAGHLDDLTASGLLSWTKGKNATQTGALHRLGRRGLLTIGDFSTVLAMSNKGNRDLLFALLRRAYDGHVTRDLGNHAEQLSWRGRVTLLACCTPIIDQYSSHADALGPRWLYYRVGGRRAAGKQVMGHRAGQARLTDARSQAATLAEALVGAAADRTPTVQVPEELRRGLVDIAVVTCYGRAAVPRSGYGRREIEGLATVEEPPRLVKQLVALARALLCLGLPADQALALCHRAALDSMPQARRLTLEILAHGEPVSVSEVARRVECHRQVARFTLEELAAIGVCEGPDDDDSSRDSQWAPSLWQLAAPSDPDLVDLIVQVMRGTGDSPDTKSALPTHLHPQVREEEHAHARTTHFSRQVPPAENGNGSHPHAEWTFADEPVGTCCVCGHPCHTLDDRGRARHPLCPEPPEGLFVPDPDPGRHTR